MEVLSKISTLPFFDEKKTFSSLWMSESLSGRIVLGHSKQLVGLLIKILSLQIPSAVIWRPKHSWHYIPEISGLC